MLEYVQKFLPAFLDNGIRAIFDFTGIGDPRPRLVANLLAFINIKTRAILLDWIPIHPSLGVNWVLYPLALVLLYRAVFCMTASTRSAFMATALYAVAPSSLDSLVNYYIPAKPLANLMLIGAIYGAARIAPSPRSGAVSRPALGAMLIFAATLCGMLSDETAIFIFAVLPVLFFPISRPTVNQGAAAIAGALFSAGLLFAITALYILPHINLTLDQIPLDFPKLVTYGVYQALFGKSTHSVLDQIRNYSPLALFAVIISAHAIPLRVVTDIWTRNSPLDNFWQWHEQASLAFFVCIMLFLFSQLQRGEKPYLIRVVTAFLVFVLVEALVILPLAPWLVEVNYYASFSSIFFALIVGHLVSSCNKRTDLRVIAWFIIAYLTATEFSNFVATSQRHPGFDKTELSWSLVAEIRKRVANGEFTRVVKDHPFPSRLFLLAFEIEASRQHAAGHYVDLQPMRRPSDTLYGSLDLKMAADPKLVPYLAAIPKDESDLMRRGGFLTGFGPKSTRFLMGRTIEGAVGPWNYRRKIDNAGNVKQRVWYTGLMRLWDDHGKLHQENDETCISFQRTNKECFARLYRLGDTFFGFDSNGELVTYFRQIDGS